VVGAMTESKRIDRWSWFLVGMVGAILGLATDSMPWAVAGVIVMLIGYMTATHDRRRR